MTKYRVDLSWWEATKSLFALHNETLNVWTHVIGFLIFLYLSYWTIWVNPTATQRVALFRNSFPSLDECVIAEGNDAHGALQAMQGFLTRLTELKDEWQDIREEYIALARQQLEGYVVEIEEELFQFAQLVREQQLKLPSEGAEKWETVRSRIAESYQGLHSKFDGFLSKLTERIGHGPSTWPTLVYLFACKVCLGCSAIFHLYCAVKGNHILSFFCKLDYAGISVLIAGSYIPVLWYLTPLGHYRFLYIGTVAVLGASCTACTFMEIMSHPKWRSFRTMLYIGYSAFGSVPTGHIIWMFGWNHPQILPILLRIGLMCCLYACGAILYLLRVPERFSPGRFDVFFHSHQFWHIFVVVAALTHYLAARDLWQLSHVF